MFTYPLTVDRLGRKPLLLVGLGVIAVGQFIVGSSLLLLNSDTVDQEQKQWLGWLSVVGISLFRLGFELAPGCLFWVIVTEVTINQRQSLGQFISPQHFK